METLLRFIAAIHPVSEPLQRHLKSCVQPKQFSKNELILKAGHVSRNLYFIEKGLLRAFYLKKDLEVSSWFIKEGNFVISVSSFFKQRPSNENIQAMEDSTLYSLSYNDLQHIYREFPEFNFIGRVNRQDIMKIAKINGLANYHKCIKELVEFGYIEYVPSYHPVLGSQVWLNSFM